MQRIYFDTTTNTYTIPDTQMEVEIIAASAHPSLSKANPIHTLRMRYPRIIHAELMTHRVFSRNARSSRAVPVSRMIQEIKSDPFVPWHWGKNQKGMQASEECDEPVFIGSEYNDDGWHREHAWLSAANVAIRHAEAFMNAGYHKQIANRLLEPFMYIDVLVTSTEWENFLWLRDHKDAEPHLQDLATLVRRALEGPVEVLKPGVWHLPYITEEERDMPVDLLRKISAARCARISYAPFDGDASYERELKRYDTLVRSDRVHASPLEHQAVPDTWNPVTNSWKFPEMHGNLNGWIQYRKLVPNEAYTPEKDI